MRDMQMLCEEFAMKKLTVLILFSMCNFSYAEIDSFKACKAVLEPVENLGILTQKWCTTKLGEVIRNKQYDINILYDRILSQRSTSTNLLMWTSHYYADIEEYALALNLAEIALNDGYEPISHGWFGYLYKKNNDLKSACEWLSQSGHGEDAYNYKRYGCEEIE